MMGLTYLFNPPIYLLQWTLDLSFSCLAIQTSIVRCYYNNSLSSPLVVVMDTNLRHRAVPYTRLLVSTRRATERRMAQSRLVEARVHLSVITAAAIPREIETQFTGKFNILSVCSFANKYE